MEFHRNIKFSSRNGVSKNGAKVPPNTNPLLYPQKSPYSLTVKLYSNNGSQIKTADDISTSEPENFYLNNCI